MKERPRDPKTKQPLSLREQPGYYPGYSTLSQQDFWDEATRKVILKRVYEVPPFRFFSDDEIPLAQAVIERILPQDDRTHDRRVPILNYIDARLYERRFDGYRYEKMPEETEAFRRGLQAIDSMARELHGVSFTDLAVREQELILKSIHDEKPRAGHDHWKHLSISHFWMLLVQDAVSAYYAHPYAWDEIGFGGPAYPRGYMRLEKGLPEPWEVDEHRYEWLAPADSCSDEYKVKKAYYNGESRPGQSGSH